MTGFRILSFRAENIKRLSVVSITPDGNIIEISGKNGQGKSSVLDAIWWALGGSGNITTHPVRKGQTEGVVEISLGDDSGERLRVKRNWTEGSGKTGYLKIETPEGMRPKSAQQMLDDLIGALSFDPMEFFSKDATGQFAILRDLVTFDENIDALDKARDDDYKTRTERNRELARARAVAASIIVPADAPEKPVDTRVMMDALTNADSFNAGVRKQAAERESLREGRERTLHEIADLKEQIDQAQELLARYEKGLAAAQAIPVPALVDSASIRADIERAEVANVLFARRAQRKIHDAAVKDIEADVERLTSAIDAIEQKKRDSLARAQMPIAGLSMDGDTVTFNGIPLDQASGAERLRVSTAIAAALNPKLRVIRIRNGNDLDEDGVKLLAEFAQQQGLQVWIERIVPGTENAVILEDGHIRGQEDLVEELAARESAQPPELTEGETFDARAYLEQQIKLCDHVNLPALTTVNDIAKRNLRGHQQELGEWNAFFLDRCRSLQK